MLMKKIKAKIKNNTLFNLLVIVIDLAYFTRQWGASKTVFGRILTFSNFS